MYPEFAPIAFLAAASVLIVLPWHWRAGNVATLSLVFWLFITNLIYGVDAIVWADNVEIIIPVWCDLTTKLIIGANVALPAACLCICIHLERVASVRMARTNISDKRRRQIFEASMCFGLPLLIMALHYIVQGHRYDIIESYGCRPTTYFSVAGIFIIWLPPILLSIASLVFAALALRHFMQRRVSFAAHLTTTHSALTTSRYLRLMLMSVLQMVWSLAITSYALWFTTISIPIRPWTTWDDVHSDFLRVDTFLTLFTPPKIVTSFYVLWWTVPASTFIFVAFFAFGRDALDEYKKCLMWFRTRVLRQTVATKSTKGSFSSVPTVGSSPAPGKFQPVTKSFTTSTTSTLPTYSTPAPPSPTKYKSTLDMSEHDSQSVLSHYGSGVSFAYTHEAEAIGSFSDLTQPPTPSTLVSSASPFSQHHKLDNIPLTPRSPPTPFPAPPRHPRVEEAAAAQTPTSPRPFTYPSLDASHRGINSPNLDIV